MSQLKSIALASMFDLSTYLTGHEVVAVGAAGDGCIYFVLGKLPLSYRTTAPNGASSAVTRPKRSPSYRVLGVRGGSVELDVRIEGEPFNIHLVQPLGEHLLLVCARSHFSASGKHEKNGRIYSRTGTFVGEVLLGDGIQDVQTAVDMIWTSYFDEGIFGNRGWTVPLGAAGLVAWDSAGVKQFEYQSSSELGEIADCYALNVVDEQDVWFCYYPDFPLIHLREGNIARHWQAPVRGGGAFAVGDGLVLFQGGYEQGATYVLAELGAAAVPRVAATFSILDETGSAISPSRTVARGENLYLVAGARVYQLDLSTGFAAV